MKIVHARWIIACGLLVAIIIALVIVAGRPLFMLLDHEAHQIKVGTAFMQSLSEQDLSEWMAWADEQMSGRRTSEVSEITLYAPEDELPSMIQGLGLIRYKAEANYVALDWLGGMGCTSLQFHRDWGSEMQVLACYTEDKSELLWPKEKKANKQQEVIAANAPKPQL